MTVEAIMLSVFKITSYEVFDTLASEARPAQYLSGLSVHHGGPRKVVVVWGLSTTPFLLAFRSGSVSSLRRKDSVLTVIRTDLDMGTPTNIHRGIAFKITAKLLL